jgi:filamentous hemagglutinin
MNALGKIFDKKTVKEQQELSSLFGQMAYEAIGEIARKHQMEAGKKNYDAAMLEKLDPNDPQIAILRQEASGILDEWGQGGTSKIALHALVGGIMSDLSGNSFGAGAAAEGVNEALQKGLGAWEEKHPGMNQWASLVIGGAVGGLTGGNPTTTGSVTVSGTKYNADVPRLLLGISPIIPDEWIDNVFNPGLKAVFTKIGTGGLDPNQYKCFAVDFGEGIVGRVGYIIDGTGNVFEVTGVGVGASILPISLGATIGVVLKQDGKSYNANDMKEEMGGLSVGFSFQGGPQGGVAVSPSGTWYGEVGVVGNAGVGGTLAKTHYLFNIND